RVVEQRPLANAGATALDAADVVVGVGRGIGGPAALEPIVRLVERLGGALAATREVTDAGWLPKQHQVGLTGRAIAPRLYVALAVSGAQEHLVGLRRAGVIVAIHKNARAPTSGAAARASIAPPPPSTASGRGTSRDARSRRGTSGSRSSPRSTVPRSASARRCPCSGTSASPPRARGSGSSSSAAASCRK